MDFITKLLDNKLIAKGINFLVILPVAILIIMVMYGLSGIPIYVMIGLIVILTIIAVIVSIKEIKTPKGLILTEDEQKLLSLVKDSGVDAETVIEYIRVSKSRSSLLDNLLFKSQYSEYLAKIRQLRYRKNLDEEIRDGKNYVIARFHFIKLYTVLYEIRKFIKAHYEEIMSDVIHVSCSDLITVIFESISKYEKKARDEGFPSLFIDEYNIRHQYIVEALNKELKVIAHSSYTTDYNTFTAVLISVKRAFDETFSEHHLNLIYEINDKMNDFYKSVTESLKHKIKSWNKLIDKHLNNVERNND